MRKSYLIFFSIFLFIGTAAHALVNPFILEQAADSYSTDEIAAYDGTDDGTNKQLWDALGDTRSQDSVCMTEDRCLLLFNYDDGIDGVVDAGDGGKLVLLHRIDDSVYPATVIDLTVTQPLGMHVVKLTDSRAFVFSEENADSSGFVGLISLDGPYTNTMNELDTASFGSTLTFETDAARLNDTQAVVAYNAASSKLGMRVIDFASDTITVGAENTTLDDLSCTQCYPAICRITDSSFMTAADGVARYYTVSGTTITEVDDVAISGAGLYEYDCARVDADTGIVFWEDADSIDANTFTISGSVLSAGTAKADIWTRVSGLGFYLQSGNIEYIEDGQILMSLFNDENGVPEVSFCDVDGSNVITCATPVAVSAENAQHPNVSVFPDTMKNYFLFTGQNEDTIPTKSIETRVIYTIDVDQSGAGSPLATDVPSIIAHHQVSNTDSYTSGETWASLVNTDWDLWLGVDGGVGGDEPAYSGSGTTAKWTISTGDYFNGKTTPASMNQIFNTSGAGSEEMCFVMAFQLGSLAGDQGLYGIWTDVSNQFWARVENITGNIRFYHRSNGTTVANQYPGVSLSSGTNYIAAFCLDYSDNSVKYAINSGTFTSYTITSYGDSATTPTNWAVGSDRAGNKLSNSSIVYHFSAYSAADILTGANMVNIGEYLETQHNIDFDGDGTVGTYTN